MSAEGLTTVTEYRVTGACSPPSSHQAKIVRVDAFVGSAQFIGSGNEPDLKEKLNCHVTFRMTRCEDPSGRGMGLVGPEKTPD
jgi:hypothetical protein